METKLREIDISTYWAPIVAGTDEFKAIAEAENPEFNKLLACIYRVLQDSFIHDATDYGVSRWEVILGITPAAGDTLDDRKTRILTQLSVKTPYTWRVLKQMLLGYLDENQFVMDYINDEGKLVLHTDRISDDKLETINTLLEKVIPQNIEVVQYNHHIEISWRDINKYAECTSFRQMTEVAQASGLSSYKEDLTSEGEWVYPIPKVTSGFEMFMNCQDVKKCSNEIVTHMTNQYRLFSTCGLSGEVDYHFPISKNTCSELLYKTQIEKANVSLPTATAIGYLVAGSKKVKEVSGYFPKATDGFNFAYECRNLRVVNAEFPALQKGDGMFISCQLDKASALRVLNSLPAYNAANYYNYWNGYGYFDIGIHIDHQNDEEVIAALAAVKAKDWKLTVRWNGTPTSGVSTLDLEEIYAKVTESEYGDYTDENGNRCTLDWGHYVTDPSEYKLFFSLVEAEQYFKLTRIENNE